MSKNVRKSKILFKCILYSWLGRMDDIESTIHWTNYCTYTPQKTNLWTWTWTLGKGYSVPMLETITFRFHVSFPGCITSLGKVVSLFGDYFSMPLHSCGSDELPPKLLVFRKKLKPNRFPINESFQPVFSCGFELVVLIWMNFGYATCIASRFSVFFFRNPKGAHFYACKNI